MKPFGPLYVIKDLKHVVIWSIDLQKIDKQVKSFGPGQPESILFADA